MHIRLKYQIVTTNFMVKFLAFIGTQLQIMGLLHVLNPS
jgi:hypothetical protein